MHSLFAGFYPFTVSVWNFFAPTSGVKLNVVFNHHQCYTDESLDFKVENRSTSSSNTIEPGKSQAFPMYFGDETVVIKIDSNGKTPGCFYKISGRDTALCSMYFPEIKWYPAPKGGSSDGFIEVEDEKDENGDKIKYYKGGIWEVYVPTPSPSIKVIDSNGWQLTIRKKVVDPQSDDVTIGPGTPG